MKRRETYRAELIEIAEYNLANVERMDARFPGLFRDEVAAWHRKVSRLRSTPARAVYVPTSPWTLNDHRRTLRAVRGRA